MDNNTPVPQFLATSVHSQHGYTLIELMVALTLGLLISAAAIQLFITSQTTFSLQQGSADVQDSSIFGLELMSRNVRMANYGGGRPVMDDFTPIGGVVLTSDAEAEKNRLGATLPVTVNLQSVKLNNAFVKDQLLTRGQGLTVSSVANEWTGISNVTVVGGSAAKSAQLVIQYRAPQTMFDCEGRTALGPRPSKTAIDSKDPWGVVYDAKGSIINQSRMIDGDVVVERYFLRKDTTGVATGESAATALVLACDAGRYSVNNAKQIADNAIPLQDYGDAGQVLMTRVDHFDLRLGVEVTPGRVRYYTVQDYLAIKQPVVAGAGVARPRLVSLQISVLARAQGKSANNALDPNLAYQMLDQQVKLTVPDSSGGVKSGYVRKVYGTTIALRNGRGE